MSQFKDVFVKYSARVFDFFAKLPVVTTSGIAMCVYMALTAVGAVLGYQPTRSFVVIWSIASAVIAVLAMVLHRLLQKTNSVLTLVLEAFVDARELANPWLYCKDGVFDDNKLLISPGELWDRLTILDIKLQKITDKKKLEVVEQELVRLKKLLEYITLAYSARMASDEHWKLFMKKLEGLTTALTESNKTQWALEDRVRSERSADAANLARENNLYRVRIKNAINDMFGFPAEMKEYKEAAVRPATPPPAPKDTDELPN